MPAERRAVIPSAVVPARASMGAFDVQVKILDFGLAKLLEEKIEAPDTGEISHLKTISAELTLEGMVFGTAA